MEVFKEDIFVTVVLSEENFIYENVYKDLKKD